MADEGTTWTASIWDLDEDPTRSGPPAFEESAATRHEALAALAPHVAHDPQARSAIIDLAADTTRTSAQCVAAHVTVGTDQ